MNKYTQAELLALAPYGTEIDFADFPESLRNYLYIQADGCRYYNRAYAGGTDGISAYSLNSKTGKINKLGGGKHES